MWITDKFIDRPITILLLGMLMLILFTVISVAAGYFELDMGGDRDFMVYDHEITEDWEMYTVAKKHISDNNVKEVEEVRSARGDSQFLVYMTKEEKAQGKGLLTQKSFAEIQKFEQKIVDHKNWTSICRAKSITDSSCMINSDGIAKKDMMKMYFLNPNRAIISPVQDSIMFIE